jgi:hypothetical protein
MNFLGMLSRFGTSLKLGALDPANHWGSNYRGLYEPAGSKVSGYVTDKSQDKRFPPASILVTLNGSPHGSTNRFERSGEGWRFAFEVSAPLSASDVVHDRIKVYAVDHRGARSELLIEGAIQLSCVRELLAPPSETELVIDFAIGGNSGDYVGSGWSNPEPAHTWNNGKQATLALSFRSPGARYRIETLAWPYVVANTLPQQTFQVSIGDTLIHTFVVGFGQKLLECDIPGEMTESGHATLRLDFLDAVRPCDVTGENEKRTIAIAFRRLTLKRHLGAAGAA